MLARLSSVDASFLSLESATTPMHVGAVVVLQPPELGLDHARLVDLVSERIALVPRYRQRVRWVPGRIANPVWVDDEDFDLAFHVRRSALPRPGSDAQLGELVSRLMSRRLDRDHPLWEVYLVEGLSGGRLAIVTKTHHAMVDGVSAVDLATVMLDVEPGTREPLPDVWQPRAEPGALGLVGGAIGELVRRPGAAVEAARSAATDARAAVEQVASLAGGLLSGVTSLVRQAPESPLNVELGAQRRFALARTRLDDHRLVRKAHGGSVNDVVLATVAGALRAWLLTRGEAVTPATTLRATVPVSVRADARRGEHGNRVAPYYVDLPVGEGSPVMRLHQVAFAMRGHEESGQAVGADALVHLSGFAPPTLTALGARVASRVGRRTANLSLTNVPGPQFPLYAAGARVLEVFPVVPLVRGQALSVATTSYDGAVCYGLNGDRDALPDLDVLSACLTDALAELVDASR